ncbi:MAG TPA: hypothetical protein VFM74_02815, partial [Candidatus Limnocylindria bacterium]|nr:hypothetical protein [Candidatus Limnocylindria bacterium]
MGLLQPGWRALAGFVIGAAAALGSTLLALLTNQLVPSASLLVLAVAIAGLTLGAAAALSAYVGGGIIIILLILLPHEARDLGLDDAVRLASFVLGTPIVVLLALRAETERRRTARAREISDLAERHAQRQR